MRRKKSSPKLNLKFGLLILFILALASGYSYFRAQLTPAPINVVSTASDPYSQIKSVTYHVNGLGKVALKNQLEADIPTIKRAGFNTVWLVYPWVYFDPNPTLTPRTYNQTSFDNLKSTLEVLKRNNMQAILPLQYFGPGWAPTGINSQNWIQDPVTYPLYKQFVNEFMRQILPYSNITLLLFHTEGATVGNDWTDAVKNARSIRATLGNIPTQLDPTLRSKFRIGFHDFILINLDWSTCLGTDIKSIPNHCGSSIESPIASPNPFDFISMVGYETLGSFNGATASWTQTSNDSIRANLQARADRFRQLYPTTPLIMGEYGYRGCENSPNEQARIVKTATQFALDNAIGFNLWGWKTSLGECSLAALDGLAITNQNGTLTPAAKELKQIFNPTTVTSASYNTDYSPWAVGVTGLQIDKTTYVNLYKNDKLWVSRHPAFVAADKSFVSFNLPSNPTPTEKIEFALIDDLGFSSNKYLMGSTPLALPSPTPQASEAPTPILTRAGVSQDYNPWAVWFTGNNLNQNTTVTLVDQNGQVWKSLLPINLSSDLSFASFRLPSNIPPSECNRTNTCTITITASNNNRQSQPITLTLPSTQ